MDAAAIRAKFGGDYLADEQTFVMGIDHRLASHIAGRFHNLTVLETCTGAGFTTIALARVAKQVVTVEIKRAHQKQARHNVVTAGFADRVTFVAGDILDEDLWNWLPAVDGAFLDPDWASTGPEHVHRFRRSTTRPPADALLARVLRLTAAAAIVLPPQLDVGELVLLPAHERQKLFLDGSHELYCLYFGSLAHVTGETECRVWTEDAGEEELNIPGSPQEFVETGQISRIQWDGVFGDTQQLTHKEWTAILAWSGYRVYRHELDEEAKTLKLWVRRKPIHRAFE